jgi:hypothetical protein
VYASVDVPDFASAALAVAGPVIGLATDRASLAIPDLTLPFGPSAVRDFSTHDRVSGLIRVTQGGTSGTVPVHVALQLTDATNRRMLDRIVTIGASDFNVNRAADYRFDVPVQTLAPGEYWLSIDATRGRTTIHRDVRFRVHA